VDGQAEADALEEEEESEIEDESVFGKLLKHVFGSIDKKLMEEILTKIKAKASEVVKTENWQIDEKVKWMKEGLFWRGRAIGRSFFTTLKDRVNSQSVGTTSDDDDCKCYFTTKTHIVSLISQSITLTCRQTGARTEITQADEDTSVSEVMTIPGDKNNILVIIETVTEDTDNSTYSLAKLDLEEFVDSLCKHSGHYAKRR